MLAGGIVSLSLSLFLLFFADCSECEGKKEEEEELGGWGVEEEEEERDLPISHASHTTPTQPHESKRRKPSNTQLSPF